MATIVGKSYKRPTSAYSKYSFGKVFKGSHPEQLKTVVTNTPAIGSVLPASQGFVTPDEYAENVICGGTIIAIGKMVGILLTDTLESTKAAYAVAGGTFLVKTSVGQFSAAGKEVWIKTTDGIAYAADGGGGVYVEAGYTVTDPEGNVTVTDPAGLPTGTYVHIVLNQIVS